MISFGAGRALPVGMPTDLRDLRLARSLGDTLARARLNLAFQDHVAIAFHLFMLARLRFAPPSAEATLAAQAAAALLATTACALVLARGELLRPGLARAWVYRLGLFVPIVASYFLMRVLLPALEPTLVDGHLHRLDEILIGVTPAVWLERFNQPAAVEWFSFFYFSYFLMMPLVILPALAFDRGRRLAELMIGALLVASVGHVVYTFVPGVGPVGATDFEGPLRGGFFWSQVQRVVDHAGAQLDIFPSLHTAYPTLFVLHAIRWRRTRPFRWSWPVLAFFAANIIVATMFLRWHWLVDVLAGLALAAFAHGVARRVAARESRRGRDDARLPVWEPPSARAQLFAAR